MVTVDNRSDYYKSLFDIQNQNAPCIVSLMPNEKVFTINLNTRMIELPTGYSLIETDHVAETIYFRVPRFYDNFDLSNTVCVIQYKNADGDLFLYPVPFFDIDTESVRNLDKGIDQPMILFPWRIAGTAAAKPGTVQFAIKFYKFEAASEITYALNTLPQTLKVQASMGAFPKDKMFAYFTPVKEPEFDFEHNEYYYRDENNNRYFPVNTEILRDEDDVSIPVDPILQTYPELIAKYGIIYTKHTSNIEEYDAVKLTEQSYLEYFAIAKQKSQEGALTWIVL